MHDQPLVSGESDSFMERPVASALSGCLYAALVITVSVAMMSVNALLCLTIYSALPEYGPKELTDRVGQFFYFVAPVVLMVVEWNLIDRLRRMMRSSA